MQFSGREPRGSMRRGLGGWHCYARADEEPTSSSAVPGSVFDPQVVVLAIEGRRVTLQVTLKLTAALRGLLMREAPAQQSPEWLSRHNSLGRPTIAPHLVPASLPFVDGEPADGRALGMAVTGPRTLAFCEAREVLDPQSHVSDTGVPNEFRPFDGAWSECTFELDTHERPPLNLQSSGHPRSGLVGRPQEHCRTPRLALGAVVYSVCACSWTQ